MAHATYWLLAVTEGCGYYFFFGTVHLQYNIQAKRKRKMVAMDDGCSILITLSSYSTTIALLFSHYYLR